MGWKNIEDCGFYQWHNSNDRNKIALDGINNLHVVKNIVLSGDCLSIISEGENHKSVIKKVV